MFTLDLALFVCLSRQLFHSLEDDYRTVGSSGLSLLGAVRSVRWPDGDSLTSPAFHVSFAALRLLLLWLLISALLRNYRRVRAELYRPAVDLQDYEMVELFLRRLKMWIGLSRTKEVRMR